MKKFDIYTTILFIVKNDYVILGKKLRGFGKGIINGIGGKLQNNETMEQCMLREVKEEIGVVPLDYKKVGEIYYNEIMCGARHDIMMYVYIANDYQGEIVESDEILPQIYNINDLPYNEMFKDTKMWLPYILKGKNIQCQFVMKDNYDIQSSNIKIIE